MSEISLRGYVDYIRDRLERDAFTEVVAQCRHVLETFPKYTEVYKLLARALLEQESYQDATDLFQRVLSADPSDFVAHVGISECYHESGAIDQAIWHLERAFEQVPNNVELQEEIKRLYAERDGSAPRQIQMTAGALARLYMKGKLYPQAILELRKALSRDPERPDLQLLLAEALWQNHQEVEAGELAARVLKRLPNSLDANRILARLWLYAGNAGEAEPFLDRIEELDPYLAYSLRHGGASAPADAYRLDMLDYTAERHASEVGAAEWVSRIRSVEKSDTVTGPLAGAPTGEGAAPSPAGEGSGVPDWLQGAFASGLEEAAQQQEVSRPGGESPGQERIYGAVPPGPSGEDEQPDWLTDILSAPARSAPGAESPSDTGSAPDWLDEIIGIGPSAPPQDSSDQDEAPAQPTPHPQPSDAPDWLKEVLGEQSSGEPAPGEGEEPPAWLAEALTDAPAPLPADDDAAPGDEREAPEWLGDILAGRDRAAERTPAATPPAPVVSTDWLDQIISGGAAAEEGDAPEEDSSAVDDDAALPGTGAGEDDTTGALVDYGELEPWDEPPPPPESGNPDPGPSGGDETDDEAHNDHSGSNPGHNSESAAFQEEERVTPPNEEPTGDDASQEIPDWLVEGDLDNSDDAIAWLEELAAKYDPDFQGNRAAGEEPAAGSARGVASTDDEGLPDWILQADQSPAPPPARKLVPPVASAASSTSGDDDDLPDWLRDEEPQEKAPVPPAPTHAMPGAAEDEDQDEDYEWISRAPRAAEPRPEAAPEAGSPAVPAAEAPEAAGAREDDIIDWLTEKPAAGAAEAAKTADELPDWLAAEPGGSAMAAPPPPRPWEEGDLPAWLERDRPEPAASAGEPELPDWLRRDRPTREEEEQEDLDWLYETISERDAAVSPPAPAAEAEPATDWLTEPDREAPPAAGAAEAPPAAEVEAKPVEEAADEVEETFAWLDEQVREQGVAPGEAVAEALTPDYPPARAPLATGEDEEAEPVAEEEKPEWLKEAEVRAEMARAEESAQAAPADELDAELLKAADLEPGEDELAWLDIALEAEEIDLTEEDFDALFGEEVEEEPAAGAEEAELEEEVEAELEEEAEAELEEEEEVPPIAAPAGMPDWLSRVEEAPEPEKEPEPAAPALSADERLRQAREKLNSQFAEAIPHYEHLVGEQQMLEQTVADLTYYLRSTSTPDPRARRILGDAYREQGKLQEALDAYRAALDEL